MNIKRARCADADIMSACLNALNSLFDTVWLISLLKRFDHKAYYLDTCLVNNIQDTDDVSIRKVLVSPYKNNFFFFSVKIFLEPLLQKELVDGLVLDMNVSVAGDSQSQPFVCRG